MRKFFQFIYRNVYVEEQYFYLFILLLHSLKVVFRIACRTECIILDVDYLKSKRFS